MDEEDRDVIDRLQVDIDEAARIEEERHQPPGADDTPDITESFVRHVVRRPEVYVTLLKFALEAKSLYEGSGMRVGIETVWERARWDLAWQGKRIGNQNLKGRYARKLMRENPELAGFFLLKDQRKH